jgi:hypothetical protein
MKDNMPRYFIAIPLPDDARDRLIAVQPPILPGMRLLGREELHLTLYSSVFAENIPGYREEAAFPLKSPILSP